MESSKIMVILSFIMALLACSKAREFQVGDYDGWSPNVTRWASGKRFEVGDTLIFNYNAIADSVLEVNHDDYTSCTSRIPLAMYYSGKDSVLLETEGETFFISGNPRNCEEGEKLRIRIHGDSDSSRDPYNPSDPSGRNHTSNSSTSPLMITGSQTLTTFVLSGMMSYVASSFV